MIAFIYLLNSRPTIFEMSLVSLSGKASEQSPRVDALDSARGWAILGVIAIHVSQLAPLPMGVLSRLAINGDMGVELFYVLSAFSLVLMLDVRAKAGQLSVQGYFIRRFFRIAPMFWFALLLATLMYFGKPSFWSPNGVGWSEIALTAIFMHGISPLSVNAVIPGGWSVAVEVMFYLCLPIIFRHISSLASALKWLAVSIGFYYLFGGVSEAYFDQILPANARYLSEIYSWYMSYPAQLPVFMLGIAAFFVVKEGQVRPRYAYVAACVGGLLLIGDQLQTTNHLFSRHFLWALVFALLVIASVQRPVYLLDNPLMRTLGRISFSVYLLHFFVLTVVGKIFRHVAIQAELKFLLLYCVVVGMTYLLAAWTYRVIELRGMKMGSQLSRRYETN